jgi:type IV pilus assembly protein PilO
MAINVSLSKLPWYGQVGLFVAIALAGVGVFWNWYVVPTQATIDTRRGELSKLRTDIDRGLATARRLPEFRREVADLQGQLDLLRTVLPEQQDVGDLLDRVNAMATQSNLTIRGFTPQAPTKKALHAEYPIGLQLEGTYHDVGAFLERISKFPRIVNVANLRIKAREMQTARATVTADCTATTFVLLEAKPATAAAPKPGGV